MSDERETPALREASFTFVRYAVFAVLIGAVAAAIGLAIPVPTINIRTVGPALTFATGLTAWFLLAGGRPLAAIWVLVGGVWSVMTAVAFFTGGVRTPIVVVYPVIILIAGWLISLPAAIALATISVAATLVLLLCEYWAYLPPTIFTPSSVYAVDQVVVYVLSAVMISFVARAYKLRVRELRSARDEQVQLTFNLETSEAELQRAQSVAKVGSWIYGIVADTVQLSDETCRIFGLPLGTHGSHDTFLARTHPDDRERVDQAWQAAFGGDDLDHEHRIRLGKKIRWIHQKAQLEFSPEGRPLRAVGVTQDITARKLAEIALQKSELQHRLLIENSHDIIYTLDANGVFNFVSAAWTALLGHPVEQVLGHRFIPFVHPDDAPVCLTALHKMFELGQPQEDIEYRVQHADGLWRWHRSNASPLRDEAGTVVGFLGSAMDITRHRQMEEQVRQMAFYDALTKLPNRRMLDERLDQTLLTSKRSARCGALMFLDLDNFKRLNDTHGHETGDLLLIEVANRLKRCVRETDTVARFGGDEFVVMLNELDTDETESRLQAGVIAEKIRNLVAEPYQLTTRIEGLPGAPLEHRCTASIGVALFAGQTASQHEILRSADAAMYQAKAAGSNLIRFAGANA